MTELGRIIGTTSLNTYNFAISKEGEEHVRKNDFVSATEPITGKEVIGIIKSIMIRNQLLPDEFARESKQLDEFMEMYDFGEGEYLMSRVDVLGYIGENGLDSLKYSLRPGSSVTLTDDEILKKLMKTDEAKSIHVGCVESRPNVGVYLDINKLIGMHSAILAMTGSGKSYTTGVVIEELLSKGGAIVMFDPHGEYKNMVESHDGSESDISGKVKVFGIGKSVKRRLKVKASGLNAEDFNAMMTPAMTDNMRELLAGVIELCNAGGEYDLGDLLEILSLMIERSEGQDHGEELTKNEKLEKGIKKLGKNALSSTMKGLDRRLRALQRRGLISREETPLDEIIRPNQLSIIDLSNANEKVREIIVSAVARKIFYARMNHLNGYHDESLKTPCLIGVEEAHNFIPAQNAESHVISRNILRRIAREGRKFGVGLCLISQRPSRLDQDVLSQCNTQIIMKIINPLDQDFIRKSAEAVTEDIIQDLPALGRGEAIITGSAINFPMHVKIKERKTKAGGSDIDIVGEWTKLGL
jgi:uncharacterized protein